MISIDDKYRSRGKIGGYRVHRILKHEFIIVILNLNNSASKYTLYLYTNKVKNTEQVKVQNIL